MCEYIAEAVSGSSMRRRQRRQGRRTVALTPKHMDPGGGEGLYRAGDDNDGCSRSRIHKWDSKTVDNLIVRKDNPSSTRRQ